MLPIARIFACALLMFFVSGCVTNVLDVENRSEQPISTELRNEMQRKGMSGSDPILIRIFKQESELEVWKKDNTGRYALLKTYPMCRWSGKLGPKKRDGDRQAPEGIYHVSSSMLNPNSKYFLSFDLGYPNRLEKALGYTGNALMVHGACSSSGCFALTDEGVAEIYALARDALRGGQPEFQVQSFPFRMTPRNLAKYRDDDNYGFWTDLKAGHDLFEATRLTPKVSLCGGRYVFNTEFPYGEPKDPLDPCPAVNGRMNSVASMKTEADPTAVEQMLGSNAGPAPHAYVDGGMHPVFRKLLAEKGADVLASRASIDAVPVSRPRAALADTHTEDE